MYIYIYLSFFERTIVSREKILMIPRISIYIVFHLVTWHPTAVILQLCIQQVESSTKISIWPLIGSTSKSWWMQRKISADFFRWGKVGTLRFRCSKVYWKIHYTYGHSMLILDDIGYVLGIFEIASARILTAVVVFLVNLSRRIQGNSSIDATKRLQHPCWFNMILICCVLFLSGVTKTSLLSSKLFEGRDTHCAIAYFGAILRESITPRPQKIKQILWSFGRIDHSLFPSPAGLVSAAIFTLDYSRATVTSFHPFSKGLPCLSPLLASIEILNKRASLEWPTSLWWRISNSPIKLALLLRHLT